MNNVTIANFNVTFGDKEQPLLEYFDSIVYPAFTSGIKRNVGMKGIEEKDIYSFIDVKIKDMGNENYVLVGKLVKETIVEIKGVMINNHIVKKNDSYPSAPYSVFYIILKNHRMVLIKNQSDSPDIKSFRATCRYIFATYVRKYNTENSNKLPLAMINVVGMPRRKEMQVILKDVKKINQLRLRFYPLNGDFDMQELSHNTALRFRTTVGSKTGSIILNTPENKSGIEELVTAAEGVMEATMDVEYNNKSKGKITSDTISNTVNWELNEESINDINVIKDKINELDELKHVSETNSRIYIKFIDVIKALII